MRTRESDESTWSSWHKIVGESGDETDFSFGISAYKTTANATTAPSDISSWSDAPLAVTSAKPYLWAKVQKKSWNASTQSYDVDSTTYIRLTGEDGSSVMAQYAPNNNPSSSQIHDTWQSGDLYMRTKSTTDSNWSSWHKIVGESGDETDYSFNISKSKTSTDSTTAPSDCYYTNWQDAPVAPTSTYPYMWMKIVKKTWNESTQSYDSGTPSYARVTGEKGDGAPIAFADPEILTIQCYSNGNVKASSTTSVIFSLKVANNSVTVSSVTSGTKPTGVTVTGVADNSVTITVGTTATASGLKNGVTFTVKGTYDGKEYSATVTVALIGSTQGEQGNPGSPGGTGPRGKIGRFFYYAGEFDSSNTTQTFVVNDAQAPYFSHGVNASTGLMNCHVYNPTENGTFTMAQMWANSSQSWNNAPWEVMTNDFKYLITQAIFGQYAHLGSFIVNGDWLISQYGTINGSSSTSYTKFYPEFIHGCSLCKSFDVYVNYIIAGSAYFIGGKTYYIKVSGSSFLSGSQLSVRMYDGSSNVGATLNLTSSSPSGTITFTPTTSGTYYLRADCQSSGMTAKLTSYVDCFVPNYAVDGGSGKTYQTQIYASGGLRSPFTYMTSGGSFTTDFNDNVAVYSCSETSYSLPWDASQSGRKVVITNYYWNGNYSTSSGFAKITAPSGKYFYEDGITKSTLKLSREAVELLGYGDASNFYGWVVLKRIDLGTVSRYGHHMKMLASGRVTGSSRRGASVSYHTFDGTTMSVTRGDTGVYTLSWSNNNWYTDAGHVFAMVCGYGVIDGGSNPLYASVKSQTKTSITVQTADDNSRNDGAFNFFLMNFNDWIYL